MKVYLAQIPYQYETGRVIYFPYSIGLLWSYATTQPIVQKNYELGELIFIKEEIDEIIDRMVNPRVFGISCYNWNMNYSMTLARRVKEKYPDCKIIAGGPEVPSKHNTAFFEKYPFVDYVIFQEGEISFSRLLESFVNDTPVDDIPGIGYNQAGKMIASKMAPRIANINDIPSPYLIGLFDGMRERADEKDLILNAIFESNRGCPFSCTFCDWGNGSLGKVKKFDISRAKKELLWFARNRIGFVVNSDANFGIFKQRDIEIAQFMVKMKKRYGYPEMFDTNWTKDNSERSVDIAKILLDGGLLRRFTASIQSGNTQTLDAIKRKNQPKQEMETILQYAESLGIECASEMIIGLPLETVDSFRETFTEVMELGRFPNTGYLSILPNSEMADPEYKLKYGLKTRVISKKYSYVDEFEEVVIATNDLTEEDMRGLNIWAWSVLQFHSAGYTNVIADFFKKYYGYSLKQFYDRVIVEFCRPIDQYPNTAINRILEDPEYSSGQLDLGIANIDVHNELGHQHRKNTYLGIKQIISLIEPDIDRKLLDDLIELQDHNQIDVQRPASTTVELNYNLWDYLYSNQPLVHDTTVYNISNPIEFNNQQSFGEYMMKTRFNRQWKTKITRTQEKAQ